LYPSPPPLSLAARERGESCCIPIGIPLVFLNTLLFMGTLLQNCLCKILKKMWTADNFLGNDNLLIPPLLLEERAGVRRFFFTHQQRILLASVTRFLDIMCNFFDRIRAACSNIHILLTNTISFVSLEMGKRIDTDWFFYVDSKTMISSKKLAEFSTIKLHNENLLKSLYTINPPHI